MGETIIQSLKRIEDIIYSIEYDNLSDYLKGVRDIINIVNGTEYNVRITDYVIERIRHETENEK